MSDAARPDRTSSDGALLRVLREGTSREHHILAALLDLPRRTSSADGLAGTLAALLASWEPLEQHLAGACIWATVHLNPYLGEAAHLLRADLTTLGYPAERSTPAPLPFRYASVAEAVGGRYVLLGSAMGGKVIADAIERWLGPGAVGATRFFRRDGLDPVHDWRGFRSALVARSWSAEEKRQAVAGALRTFGHIGAVAAPLLDGGRCGGYPHAMAH